MLSVAAAPHPARACLEPFRVGPVAGLTANEWQRPALGNPLLLVVLAAAVVALLGLVRSRRPSLDAALTVVAAALALWMVRTIAVGAIVLAPALAAGLSSLARSREPPRDAADGRRSGTRHPPVGPSGRPGRWRPPASRRRRVARRDHAFGPPVTGTVSTAAVRCPDAGLAVDGRAVGWTQWAHRDRRPLRDLRAEVYSVPVATAYEDFQEARPGWQA